MLKNDMWKIFETTGRIDAYLYCKDLINDQENHDNQKHQDIQDVNNEGSNMQG